MFVVTAVAGAACGGIETPPEDPDARETDASEIDTAPAIDAVPARCNPTAPFGTPTHVNELNATAHDECARLSLDERTVYFSSTRGGGAGGWDIWFAERGSRDAAWGQPMLLGGAINTVAMERCPAVTDDQLAIYADNYGTNYNLAVSTRQTTSETFGAMTLVNELNISTMGAMQDADPSMGPNRTIYWSSDAQGNFDIHRATWNGSSFRTPERVTGTNLVTAETEAGAVVSRDELTLFFQSARTGSMNSSYDIWMATRSSTVAAFGEPVNLAALNSNGIEYPNWISEDGCVMYFTRDVGVGAVDYNIMMAIRGM
jgi:hypothetical protein